MIAGHPATRLSPGSQINSRPLPFSRSGQLGDKKGERRVSEATINHRPPLPPSISGRSQSLDGLLDDNSTSCAEVDVDDEGASDVVDGRCVGGVGLEARSLEVLLDENEDQQQQQKPEKVLRPPRREERSKSVDNYLSPNSSRFDSMPRTRSPSEKFCESETLIVDEAKQKTDTAYNSEEEGPRVVVVGAGDEESKSTSPSSAVSRQNSTTSSGENPERKKTFINRLGKRVRSMIKK